jgi:hypothetical protein
MIRAADLMPLAGAALRPAPVASGNAAAPNPSSWFDGDGFSAGLRIGVDLAFAARGLGVAQHAERVLGHLCAEPPDRA